MKAILILLVVLPVAVSSSLFGNLFRENTSEEQCPIKLYNPHDTSFTGAKIYANAETFSPLLANISDYAKRCHLKINVKRAFVQETSPLTKIVTDENIPLAFQLGEAIEFDLVDKNNKVVCGRTCLKKSTKQLKHLPNVKCFVRKIAHNHNLQRDSTKPTIIMKRRTSSESSTLQADQRKIVQNKCKKLNL